MLFYFIFICSSAWPIGHKNSVFIWYLYIIDILIKEEATVRSSVEAEDANERRYYEYEETLLDYYHGSCILFYV